MSKLKEYPLGRIFNSFSGGRSSGRMTKFLIDNYSDTHEIVHVFANTGQEHESTLEFVDRCDRAWDMNLVWVESKVDPIKGNGTRFTRVNYKTACRDGRLFDEMCSKYGVPNKAFSFCTRELKLAPMTSYMRHIGWKNRTYHTSIGLRSDEMDRISEHFIREKYIYPLIDTGETKQTVNDWWAKQAFDLQIKGDHWGNCTWCWKKSLRKHFALIREDPSIFAVPRELEKKYGRVAQREGHNGSRVFFRKNMSTERLFELSQEQLDMFWTMELDESFGCEESCEPIGTDKSIIESNL